MKRANWLDALMTEGSEARVLAQRHRDVLFRIDDALFETWGLGDNLILVWTRQGQEFRFLSVRHYAIIESFDAGQGQGQTGERGQTGGDGGDFINRVLAGPKFVLPADFDAMCAVLGAAAQVSRIGIAPADQPADDLITRLVTRYGVTLVRERAVVLLDAVGFSLHSPIEQVAMLNSLSYSVNSAYRQLLSKDIEINFARTTTGDGFYIWNRQRTVDANIALYKLMMLILTDNAVAQRKARRFPVPRLRAAFHVGEHYEFYQVEALNPTTFGYIVGQVTIELSRMIERALPGQILLGDFSIGVSDAHGVTQYDTLNFVEQTAATLEQMKGLAVANDSIEEIRCYLTGEVGGDGRFQVSRYQIQDKHGLARTVRNAKINLHLRGSEPIYLGLQHRDLHRGDGSQAWPAAQPPGG